MGGSIRQEQAGMVIPAAHCEESVGLIRGTAGITTAGCEDGEKRSGKEEAASTCHKSPTEVLEFFAVDPELLCQHNVWLARWIYQLRTRRCYGLKLRHGACGSRTGDDWPTLDDTDEFV
jgi:hypothetical protein